MTKKTEQINDKILTIPCDDVTCIQLQYCSNTVADVVVVNDDDVDSDCNFAFSVLVFSVVSHGHR